MLYLLFVVVGLIAGWIASKRIAGDRMRNLIRCLLVAAAFAPMVYVSGQDIEISFALPQLFAAVRREDLVAVRNALTVMFACGIALDVFLAAFRHGRRKSRERGAMPVRIHSLAHDGQPRKRPVHRWIAVLLLFCGVATIFRLLDARAHFDLMTVLVISLLWCMLLLLVRKAGSVK